MTLPENLLKAATLGTNHQSFEAYQVTAVPTDSPAARLLLAVATSTLREHAGYIAGRTALPLPNQSAPDETTLCSDRAMDHLRLMLSSIHTDALQEWLIAAANAKQHVQADVLPKLLLLGQKKPMMRPYLYPVLGQRAKWLASEITNQNWGWILKTPEKSLAEAIESDRLYEQELISQMPTGFQDALRSLGRYHLVWSSELTETFIHKIKNINADFAYGRYWVYIILRLIMPLAYHFPMEASPEIIKSIQKLPSFNSQNAQEVQGYIDTILNFRREMLAEIARGEPL